MVYENIKDLMAGICNAVREKEGSTGLIPHQELPERIGNIQSGNFNSSLMTNSSKLSLYGSSLDNVLQIVITSENLGYSYEGVYRDTSPYEETINVSSIPNISGFNISASNLYVKGSVIISVKYKNSEEYVNIVSDTSSTENVWGGVDKGGITYNREYIFDELVTNISDIKVVMTKVYRCSFTMKFYVSE